MAPDARDESAHAWAAGFLDGEGWLGFGRGGSGRNLIDRPIIQGTQNTRLPLERLRALYGGHISPHNNGRAWRWQLKGRKTVHPALVFMLPYFTVKREAAEQLLAFCELGQRTTANDSLRAAIVDRRRNGPGVGQEGSETMATRGLSVSLEAVYPKQVDGEVRSGPYSLAITAGPETIRGHVRLTPGQAAEFVSDVCTLLAGVADSGGGEILQDKWQEIQQGLADAIQSLITEQDELREQLADVVAIKPSVEVSQ